MNSFRLKIITPDKIFFEGQTEQLTVRTTEGNVGILAGHINYCALLPSGPLRVKQEGGFRDAAVSGGAITVANNEATIIASAVEWADEIDFERAKRSEENARTRLEAAKSKKDMDRAEQKLRRALNRLSVSGKY